MKATLCIAAVAIAAMAMSAQGQTTSTGPATVSSQIFGGYDYPGYYGASTLEEGARRGVADIIRSKGDYNLSTSAAAINFSAARRSEIENDKAWTRAYFEMREFNRQQVMAENRRLRGNPADYFRYAQAGKPKPLTANELDAVTGEIRWPILLTAQEFEAQRTEVEKAFAERAYHGVMGADTFLTVSEVTENMLAALKSSVRDLPPAQYVMARRFLVSLAYEAGQPAG